MKHITEIAPCAWCFAPAGELCRTKTGGVVKLSDTHTSRGWALREAMSDAKRQLEYPRHQEEITKLALRLLNKIIDQRKAGGHRQLFYYKDYVC